jgi:serine/threonine protein kinase
MKILSKSNVVKRKQVEHTITERRVLGYTRHPFIIQLHYAFQTRDKLFLVVDYAGGGEMFFHLGRLGRFKESMARFYSAQLVLALGHLHKLGVVYRDLKPENVLFDELGHVKLADFGLSKEGITESTEGTKSFCGTPEYLAPEVLNRTGHGTAVDWWSLGSLIYEMLTGLPPWYTRDRKLLYERLRSAPLEFPSHVSEHARSIISSLLVRDPSARLGAVRDAAELMEHPFFSGMDWRALYKRELTPPFLPQVRAGEGDTRYFDAQFTEMPANIALEDEKESPTNPPNSLFANFTYDGPSMLASRPSRGLSFSLAPSPTVGGGSFSMDPAGRDGVPITGPGGATLRRTGSNNASQLGVSYGGGPPQRTISSDIAGGISAVKFNPGGKEPLDKEKLPVLPSGPSGLTQLLKGDSARSSPRPDAVPVGVSRPVAVHGASPSLRGVAPTGVPAVSPILQYPSDTRGYSNRVITGATVSPVVAPSSYHPTAGGYATGHYSRGSPSAITPPLAIPHSSVGGYDSMVPRPPSASARVLNVTRGVPSARTMNPEPHLGGGAGSARKGYSTAR